MLQPQRRGLGAAGGVGSVQGTRHGADDLQRRAHGQRASLGDAFKVHAVHVLQHQGPAVGQANQAVHLHDGRVVQEAQHPGFVAQAAGHLVGVGHAFVEHLEGDQLGERALALVAGPVEGAQAAATDHSQDLVAVFHAAEPRSL